MTDRPIERERSNEGGGSVLSIARGETRRLFSPAWLARTAGVVLCVSAVGFVVVAGVVLGESGELALITRPAPLRFALVLPYVVLVSTVATVVGTGLAWWNRYWSLPVRIHQTVLAVLGVGVTWQLVVLGFLG